MPLLIDFERAQPIHQIFFKYSLIDKDSLIDFYKTRSPNPTLNFIERAVTTLEVSVAELLGSEPNTPKSKPGPASQLQRKFEQVKLLPREKQKFVLQFLDTVLNSNQQKA